MTFHAEGMRLVQKLPSSTIWLFDLSFFAQLLGCLFQQCNNEKIVLQMTTKISLQVPKEATSIAVSTNEEDANCIVESVVVIF